MPIARVVSSRLRVLQRNYLSRRGGRVNVVHTSTAVDYAPGYIARYKRNLNTCPRIIDAEFIHGDEQSFWTARRDFYRSGASRSYYPVWDRQAQALIMLTRQVPRVPQEAAFRLFTLGLRLLLMPRLIMNAELMLPSWMLSNTEGLLAETISKKDGEKDGATKPPGDGDAAPAAGVGVLTQSSGGKLKASEKTIGDGSKSQSNSNKA
ncbi:unnamed protein product [Phytomonas sp. EM1]|nr:unnamed protein product [Phytomonas sp. EM1]|eukprot:CCW60238.1 unnamed protein product [Phytomonas sp. isolate EM1]